MDSVVGVTQCPIAPNNLFKYSFLAGGQTGTFWYHSHFSMFGIDQKLDKVEYSFRCTILQQYLRSLDYL